MSGLKFEYHKALYYVILNLVQDLSVGKTDTESSSKRTKILKPISIWFFQRITEKVIFPKSAFIAFLKQILAQGRESLDY